MMRYVLYHSNCPDGFGAAWAAHKKYGDAGTQYIPVSYGKPPPEMPVGSVVLICDFSYPRDTLIRMLNRYSVHVEDHHKTAQADLEGLSFCHFDMDHSGAVLTWNYLFPDEPVPYLLLQVQDRDLWKMELPHSKEISAWLHSFDFDFADWDSIAKDLVPDTRKFAEIIGEGSALLRQTERYVSDMCRHWQYAMIGGYQVPVANATVAFSDVGDRLCTENPAALFAAYYIIRNDGLMQFGLRSRNGFDTSAVATQYGGGGHLGASGFTVPLEEGFKILSTT